MIVHHLNCGTMNCPTATLVCHVLLIETDAGLVLVDSGFGMEDIADPAQRLGGFRRLIRPALDPRETAVRQVERLGFAAADVRHIIITHMDLDHIGGLTDFPHAQVHLTAAEALGSMWSPSRRERLRYRPAQWSHGPKVVEHAPQGEQWQGFAAAKELTAISHGVVLVSLPGHSRGHCAVAVDTGHGWLLQAGDAFYDGCVLGGDRQPKVLHAMETMVAWDREQVRRNHDRLAELHQRRSQDITIVNAHDPALLAAAHVAARS